MTQTRPTGPSPFSEFVASEIRSQMARKKISQTKLALRLDGRSQPWISRRLNGEVEITIDDVVSIADALGVYASAILEPALPHLDSNQEHSVLRRRRRLLQPSEGYPNGGIEREAA
jgi:transcriptional regulator with XRE-family HTH domain